MDPIAPAPSSLLAFTLSRPICSRCLSAQLTTRPFYTRFARAAETLIRTIHALPSLYPAAHLSQLSFYLGRAGATATHVLDRWRDHASEEERGHDYGLVLCRASTADILLWERLANRALRFLADHARLVVANIAPDGRGPAPATADSCLYLTWELCPPQPLVAPRSTDARALATALSDSIAPARTQRAFAALTRSTRERLALRWAARPCDH